MKHIAREEAKEQSAEKSMQVSNQHRMTHSPSLTIEERHIKTRKCHFHAIVLVKIFTNINAQ